jgi:hypothetical protein
MSLKFTLPNAFGTSGSPIFSRPWHDVVALHWGGLATPPQWQSSGVAAHDILTDLEERLATGEIQGAAAAAVHRIQERATGLPRRSPR